MFEEGKYATAKRKRKEHVDAIVNSPSNKKIVVAGPGTGKTHLFEKILEGKTKTLTLTFVNALVEDLSLKFCELSKVRTLHSFALEIMKKATKGDIKVYPRLTKVISNDAKILLKKEIDFEKLFQNKTAEEKEIDFYKRRKKYYGGCYGFSDIIFAAVMFLEENKDEIQTFKQVLVDEFQDFNESEVAIIDLLAEKSPILLAGDDDQALYQFKSAGPQHIRQRYSSVGSDYAPFSLPYCSRSTRVIVDATNDIITAATRNGHLNSRIRKPFKYFDHPDNDKIGDKNQRIIYRQLQANQIPTYIKIDIEQIAKEERSKFTVLIICPYNIQCNTVIYALKKMGFLNVNYKKKEETKPLTLLDGLKLLLKEQNCNLGWRIVAEKLLNNIEFEALLKQTNEDDVVRVFDLIKKGLRKDVRQILQTLREVRGGKQTEDEPELSELLKRIDIDAYAMARNSLKDEIKPYDPSARKVYFCKSEVKKIPITVTTIESSKGLDADYVFITFFDDEYFLEDKDNTKVSDHDICKFIVSLTRAIRKVFLFSSDITKKPVFLKWIDKRRIEEI